MELLIEHRLKPAMGVGFRAAFLCVSLLLYVFLGLPNPLWAGVVNQKPVFASVSVEGGENSFAFLIFNNDYNKGISPVENVGENKKGMQALLAGLGIPSENIIVLENPSESDLEDEIYQFSRKLSSKADLLVYYNGHSVNFTDTPVNEILLTSFKLPRSNDLFLLERRVSRSSVSLDAMISEFTPKRVGHITVFYDACNKHFVERADDAEHWEVFNPNICATSKVAGADIFYAGTQTGPGSLVNALTAILSKKPTIDLLALETELLNYAPVAAKELAKVPQKTTFVASAQSDNLAKVCLRKSLQDGNLVCNATPHGAKVEVTKADQNNDATASDENTVEPTTLVEEKNKPPKKSNAMRDDWAAAKRAGTCKPYQDFVANYPNAVFKAKAERAITIFCAVTPKKKVAVEKTDDTVETGSLQIKKPTPIDEILDSGTKKPTTKKSSFKDWMSARKQNTCEGYLEFVKNHPEDVFVQKAKKSIDRLCVGNEPEKTVVTQLPKTEPEVETVEKQKPAITNPVIVLSASQMWRNAGVADTCDAYLDFLGKHPQTMFSLKANVAVAQKCSDADRLAFGKKQKSTVPDAILPTGDFANISEDDAKNRYALVVVNQDYTSGFKKIAGTEADKAAILAVISGLKYPTENVKLLVNAGKDDLEAAVSEFTLNMKPNSDLLLYYSGYSITSLSGKTNLILPADFTVPDSKQTRRSRRYFKENSVDLKALIRDLGQGNPRQITVVYNACSSQALPEEKDAPYWLFLKPTPCSPVKIKNASIFYPARNGQFALTGLGADDNDKRSLFMRVFEDTVSKNPAIEIRELHKQLAWSVAALANGRSVGPRHQDPVFRDGYRLDPQNPRQRCLVNIMLNGALACTDLEGVSDEDVIGNIDPEPDAPALQAKTAQEGWQEAKRLDTCQSYQDFKKIYTNTIYSLKVELKMKEKCAMAEDIILPVTCEATGDATLPFGLTKIGYREMQRQLNRLGCNVGAADGNWGLNSQAGFERLKKLIKLDEITVKPSCGNLEQIKAFPTKRICPLVCGPGFKKVNKRCVRVKPIAKAPTKTKPVVTKKGSETTETNTDTLNIDGLKKILEAIKLKGVTLEAVE